MMYLKIITHAYAPSRGKARLVGFIWKHVKQIPHDIAKPYCRRARQPRLQLYCLFTDILSHLLKVHTYNCLVVRSRHDALYHRVLRRQPTTTLAGYQPIPPHRINSSAEAALTKNSRSTGSGKCPKVPSERVRFCKSDGADDSPSFPDRAMMRRG